MFFTPFTNELILSDLSRTMKNGFAAAQKSFSLPECS